MSKKKIIIQEKLISIVMPAYNAEKYIRESIQSVLDQTYSNWELIVIDDGSKDNTIEIIKSFEMIDSRVKLFKNEVNIGVSKTRNKAIALATGNWIAFLDSDDIWKSEKLEMQILHSQKYDSEFIYTGSAFIDENGLPFNGIFEVPSKISYRELLRNNTISCSSVLIKKDLIEGFKMEKDNLHEDYVLWLQLLETGIYAHGINEPYLIYRITKSSKSGNKIKSVFMTFRVYRFLNIGLYYSTFYTLSHLVKSAKKYRKIYN